ncbi:MAG: hypothetical protein GYB25_10930 [Rhodobacteraceae bacterium]|nr:hypothetical protein [Paracoccaceae bacterium]
MNHKPFCHQPTRRGFFTGLAATVGAMGALPRGALAFEECNQFYQEEIWNGFQSAFSVPYGPQDRDGQIYAIVAPWCPYCRQMKEDIKAGQVDARVSFIPAEPRDALDRRRIAYLLTSGDLEAVDKFFDRKWSPSDIPLSGSEQSQLLSVQQHTMHTFSRVLTNLGKTLGFPMWVTWAKKGPIMARDGLFIEAGWVNDPRKISSNLSFMNVRKPEVARSWDALRNAAKVSRFSGAAYAKTDRVVARVLPMNQAMPTFCYKQGFGHDYIGTVKSGGKDWLVLEGNDGFFSYVDTTQMDIVG